MRKALTVDDATSWFVQAPWVQVEMCKERRIT